MARKPRHEHELRMRGGSPTLVKASLPEGKLIDWWQPPVASERLPDGLGPVEYLIDGKIVAKGLWPDVLEKARG